MSRFMALSIIVLSAAVIACGLFGSGRPAPVPTRPAATRPLPTQPPPTQPPPTAELPVIDVAIIDINLPAHVARSQTFEFTITAQNMNLSGPAANSANVEIRAQISDASGATDLYVGQGQFRNLEPNKPVQLRLQGNAPNRPGVWKLYAMVKPFGFKDPGNNTRESRLVVD